MTSYDPSPSIAADKRIFRGDRQAREESDWPEPPPWRRFNKKSQEEQGSQHRADSEEIDAVNAAIYLRRPLLITGKPGTGKTSLAYAVAYELGLGEVLLWPITSRSTLQQGLYHYDAIGRLQDASLQSRRGEPIADTTAADSNIGQYIRLGPLGAAFHGSTATKPRLLLIDEIDKSDIDLPNDLLHIFEEGAFEIHELSRLSEKQQTVEVNLPGAGGTAKIERGYVRCSAFPIVFLTSNGERDFPPAFKRRCIPLTIREPNLEALTEIVRNRMDEVTAKNEKVQKLIQAFLQKRDVDRHQLATDQLLNAIQLLRQGVSDEDPDSSTNRFTLQPL